MLWIHLFILLLSTLSIVNLYFLKNYTNLIQQKIYIWSLLIQLSVIGELHGIPTLYLGYNDFNNLVVQTLWWLPIKILRHIHKKRYFVFLSRFLRICNQSVQKKLIRAKQIFILKNSMWVSKNAEFHPVF